MLLLSFPAAQEDVVARVQVLCPKSCLYLSLGSECLPSMQARLCLSLGGEGNGPKEVEQPVAWRMVCLC